MSNFHGWYISMSRMSGDLSNEIFANRKYCFTSGSHKHLYTLLNPLILCRCGGFAIFNCKTSTTLVAITFSLHPLSSRRSHTLLQIAHLVRIMTHLWVIIGCLGDTKLFLWHMIGIHLCLQVYLRFHLWWRKNIRKFPPPFIHQQAVVVFKVDICLNNDLVGNNKSIWKVPDDYRHCLQGAPLAGTLESEISVREVWGGEWNEFGLLYWATALVDSNDCLG